MCPSRIPGRCPPLPSRSLSWETLGSRSSGRPTVKKRQSSGRCRVAVVMSKLDIFAKSQASVCIDKKSVLKKEVASLHLAERLANMAAEQELWTSYPLSALEARVHALSTQTALRHTLSRRPNARCVFANCPLRCATSTTGASQNWHFRRQQPSGPMAPATANPYSGRLRWTISFSKQLESTEAPKQAVHDPLVQASPPSGT